MKLLLAFLCLIASSLCQELEPIVLVHGGAGFTSDERDPEKFAGTKLAARMGFKALMETGSVLDAVEQAVRSMELNGGFNAGYGAVLTMNWTVEMDASIMDGRDLSAGCVSGVQDILHPISLARLVKDRTPHTFLSGEGLLDFARKQNVHILYPPGQMASERAKASLQNWLDSQAANPGNTEIFGEPGTVGAVAMDAFGNLAAATSTGGITGKYSGRVGDTPLLGSGTYADNRYGAVSTTGHGESIMKINLAKDIINRIAYLEMDVQNASMYSVEEMTELLDNTAGVIALDSQGNPGIYTSSGKMSWAYQRGDTIHYGIRPEDHFTEEA
ncbi:probable isoaspartyl peptidase/L-asparaginase CG7860 [Phlebotomus papatasi]|uniref:probable isoaspartyl peptidase/L-asparaginase CG7860 n=1 Tax=Phlebotomus papatasi TaxID=29031 RepID=UPI0024843D40|nr:probable isoaspartyl peptidase/L-asparaginase CG7860 [Phlebotomus papatasi]